MRRLELCRCELCGVELDEPEQAMLEHDASEGVEGASAEEEFEEGQAAKPLAQPRAPSRRMVEDHELTHIPYRSWCSHCRKARGAAMAHRKNEEEEAEEKEGAMTTWAMDYTFLTDDFDLLTRTEAEKLEDKSKIEDTVLVCDDRRSGGAKAHLVECKGIGDSWVARRFEQPKVGFYKGGD